jgi:hypothetical protein
VAKPAANDLVSRLLDRHGPALDALLDRAQTLRARLRRR